MKAPFLLLILLAFAAPSAVGAAPLRTLTYHFSFDARGFGSSIATTGNGAVIENGLAGTNSRSGSIRVDVIQATGDGGLVVDVTEHVDRDLHDLQTIRCAVYGGTQRVICDQNLHATSEETVLLQYLGRFFYDASKVDSSGHWHVSPPLYRGFSVDNDYTIKKRDGNVLTISISRRESGGGYLATTDGTLIYDAAFDVPDSIKMSTSSQRAGGQGDMNVELKLLTDSMSNARAASSAPH